MYKLLMTIRKEVKLLSRDLGGLAILFIMPVFLVIVVTLIQNNTYENITNHRVKLLVIDQDQDQVSQAIFEEVKALGSFELLTSLGGEPLTEERAAHAVLKGDYQLAIVIPKQLTQEIQHYIDTNVEEVLQLNEAGSHSEEKLSFTPKEVVLYFDPALQIAYKEGIKAAIDRIVTQTENKFIYSAFAAQLDLEPNSTLLNQQALFTFKEISPLDLHNEVKPNAVQHNVPAWSLFAIFFIIVPFAMNLVKEKNQGTKVRLYTVPTHMGIIWAGKIITYLVICLLQFYLILGVGKFVFPSLGLLPFTIGNQLFNLSVLTLCIGLSAISLGVVFGTVAQTQEQSSPFGATFVVILAAVSGVWVPTFAMPVFMQYVAQLSPMNWGLEGYYALLLRQGSLWEIRTEIILLLLFALVMISIALFYDKKKRSL
ncbi:ABC transporter permease [Myroides sp. DF42-4-2]|uniref:ABC transporter permease n=1 Tax=unclassified Myroides TaxID=2642485 RepID=UPI0025776641|nr:ABC transporter permease [Myroides sp. DF42-4-2]MDM1406917.1 ABC transporter permease [Myroides sp. DF42-4-2]